jgi:hypothetical protein
MIMTEGEPVVDLECRVLDDTAGQKNSGCKAAVFGRDSILFGVMFLTMSGKACEYT